MRRIRYSVAMSLDGYIAGPNGEHDWITMDPELDFAAIFGQFDTLLVGRRTYDEMVAAGRAAMPGMTTVVFSRTLRPVDHPSVTVVSDRQYETLIEWKARPGKDIWLFGGSTLFGSLASQGLVDTVEVTVCPVLLGGGVPLLSGAEHRIGLSLTSQRTYKSGVVALTYNVTCSA